MTRPLLVALLLTPALATAAPEEEVNALALVAGAREMTRGTIGNAAVGLTDGDLTIAGSFEPSRTSPTLAVVYRLAEPFDLTRAAAVNSGNERDYPGISTKRLRLEHGAGEDGPWKPLGEATLKKGQQPQPIALAKASGVRWVRVTLLENYGDPEWWSLAELQVFGRRTQPREPRFTGVWDATYGTMRLTQSGQRVTGCYGGDEKAGAFTVDGVVDGPVFFGTWVERSDDDSGRDSRGSFAFVLTAEGELSGVWGGDGNETRTSRWDGTPSTKTSINCETPEKSMASDLAEGRVVLRGILFDTGKDVLRPESLPVLEALAAAMRKTSARYVVEGHTDDRGGEAPNLALSDRRAASVRAWLVKAGIAEKRLETKGFGQSRPTLPNDSEAGRAANRRVEVAVLK